MATAALIPRFQNARDRTCHSLCLGRSMAIPIAQTKCTKTDGTTINRFLTERNSESADIVVPNQLERVTLKIDIPYTDHSHMIGRGGRTINAVMRDTNCHIHFPDSNCVSLSEKSNQVTISGRPIGVEKARLALRKMLSLTCTFEVHLNSNENSMDLQLDPHISGVEQCYNVDITFHRCDPHVDRLQIKVKGFVSHEEHFKHAVALILQRFYGEDAPKVRMNMEIEVDPKHHPFLRSNGGQGNIAKAILHESGATVCFPDNFTRMRNLRKGTVTVSGIFGSVFRAREYISNSLPVSLSFDIFIEEYARLESLRIVRHTGESMDLVTSICISFGVEISIRSKLKQDCKAVIIKTKEKNVDALCHARSYLLNHIRHTEPSLDAFPVDPIFHEMGSCIIREEQVHSSLMLPLTSQPLAQYNASNQLLADQNYSNNQGLDIYNSLPVEKRVLQERNWLTNSSFALTETENFSGRTSVDSNSTLRISPPESLRSTLWSQNIDLIPSFHPTFSPQSRYTQNQINDSSMYLPHNLPGKTNRNIYDQLDLQQFASLSIENKDECSRENDGCISNAPYCSKNPLRSFLPMSAMPSHDFSVKF